MFKTIYVGFSFNHHGEHAGYDQIRKYLKYNKIINCQKSFNFISSIYNNNSIFSRIYRRLYDSRLWWIELELILMSAFNRKKLIFHIIYGENIFKYLACFKFGNKIILTLHQPPSYFEEINQRHFLRSLNKVDKLITMSEDMEIYFKEKFPDKEIQYIPHGVDTKYFSPKGLKGDQILMIGNWLRNFEFANLVFKRLTAINPQILITIVTNRENHSIFNNLSVKLLNSISDEELLNLYQTSKVVFLPLKQFTANNALLEAWSCGCQIIISTQQENFLKLNESSILFVENNVEEVCHSIIDTCIHWEVENERKIRENVKQYYSWETIALKTKDFLIK